MKYLITGGSGFIGSHLVESYLTQGHEVSVIDDLSTGSFRNLYHLRENEAYDERFQMTVDNVMDREVIEPLVKACDVVIHLAAAVEVPYILEQPLNSIFTNVDGTKLVLEYCCRYQKRVLIASTSEVYGKQMNMPLRETDDCVLGPSQKSRWSYATSKLLDEFLGLAYHRTQGIPVTIVRIFNTVGPRQTGRYGMVVPRFVNQALSGQHLTVYGEGCQTRNFTHVKDTVEAMVKLLETSKSVGEVVNIGSGEEVSIFELAERIKKRTHSSSEIRLLPYDEVFPADFEDMMRRVPSTEKLKALTGFEPKRTLDEILEDVIAAQRR